jgi:hypothetical protein
MESRDAAGWVRIFGVTGWRLAAMIRLASFSVVAALLLASPQALAAPDAAPITTEQQAAMEAVMRKHMADLEPAMKEAAGTLKKTMDTPENRAVMDKMAREMETLAKTQGEAMVKAVQPMMADMLPRLLRMQADMLEALFTPPPAKEAAPKR